MKKVKLLTMSILVIGTLAGCANTANDDVAATDVAVSEEISSVEETMTIEESTAIEETTTIAETEVAKTESVEDYVDDVTYNTGIIMSFGIRQEDAAASADFLDKISYGKIDASRRVEKGGETRFEVTNKDGIIYYLVKNEDTVREILNVKGEFIVSITINNSEENLSSSNGNAPEVQSETSNKYGDFDIDDPDDPVEKLDWIP